MGGELMPRVMPNAIPFMNLRSICHASLPMRACVAFQDKTGVQHATHFAQCVYMHRPLRSFTLCTKCRSSCPLRSLASYPSEHHLVYHRRTHHAQCNSVHHFAYHMPRITPISCVRLFQDTACVSYATHHAQCVCVHRPLLSSTLCTISHASCPMQFRESPCVPYAAHHTKCVSVHRPLPSIIVYHMPRITPNACWRLIQRLNLCTICHAPRPMRFRASSLSSITLYTKCHSSPPKPACIVLPRVNLCTICHASRPVRFRASSPSEHLCVANATHHTQNVRASPSKIKLEYHMPCITPIAFPCIVPFRASPCVPDAKHHAHSNSVHYLV